MSPNDTITIPLTQGQSTVIDAIDADLAQHKWQAYLSSGKWYAKRISRENGINKKIALHKVILERKLGRKLINGEITDHQDNENTLDNTRDNLRVATRAENARNSKKQRNNTSGYKGVSWHKRRSKWSAIICVNNKLIFLGYYDDPKDAHQTYCEAAIKYHGEFARFE